MVGVELLDLTLPMRVIIGELPFLLNFMLYCNFLGDNDFSQPKPSALSIGTVRSQTPMHAVARSEVRFARQDRLRFREAQAFYASRSITALQPRAPEYSR